MDGNQKINECVLRFEKEGLKINANDQSKQARVMSWLKSASFDTYEELGNVGMNDMENIVKVLERFGEFINIKKEGNLLTIAGDSKKVDIELVSENFLDTDTGEPTLTFEDTFSITAAKLKDVFKDVTMNKDTVLTITTEEKKVKFSNTGKYKFLNEIGAPTCKGGVVVKFGEPLINAASQLDGNLEMSVATNYPIKIRETNEESVITLIVAPRVDEE